MSQKIGSLAEQQARGYLTAQGLRWIESNHRCRMGEIDLIMRDREHLVFVEVRIRSSVVYGGAIASVTFSKKQKLIKTALHYLLVNQLHDKQPIRFDVLSIDGVPPIMTWVKNAFGADY
jgi:putative endonuclease